MFKWILLITLYNNQGASYCQTSVIETSKQVCMQDSKDPNVQEECKDNYYCQYATIECVHKLVVAGNTYTLK